MAPPQPPSPPSAKASPSPLSSHHHFSESSPLLGSSAPATMYTPVPTSSSRSHHHAQAQAQGTSSSSASASASASHPRKRPPPLLATHSQASASSSSSKLFNSSTDACFSPTPILHTNDSHHGSADPLLSSDLIPDSHAVLTDAERDWLAQDTRIPKSIAFIVGNEFCERFTFYGIKSVLLIYLTRYLRIESNSATAAVHAFNMFAYTATLLGGTLSDGYLGRFRTIIYLSLVYCIGNLVLSLTAVPGVMPVNPSTGAPSPWGALLGLTLLALGTGGIKPCVSAFGGDQFHPAQVAAISIFFSLFYAAINSGSLLSMFITPILRSTSCFGRQDCFSLAFGLPSVLMLVSTAIFVAGRKYYRMSPPEGNVLGRVFTAIGAARRERARVGHDENVDHWLDYAALDPEFAGSSGAKFLADVKQLLSVVWVFLPLPLFWTLYDQQGSRWTSQALLMQSTLSVFGLFDVTVKPDQMQVTNALLILSFIPLFQRFVYPNVKWLDGKPLRRMALGMVLTGVSFVMAGTLQYAIDAGVYASMENGQLVEVTDHAARAKLAEQGTLVCLSGCVPIVWQVPQYIVITAGEILFSITGLEFAYSQSPPALKSVCQAAWQMTVAVGNLLVIVIAESRMFDAAPELFFFAGCIFVAAVVFVVMASGYVKSGHARPMSPGPLDAGRQGPEDEEVDM
ncbi:POT family-domain-containing protein [Catenaria anguillulae PL171]|uniref:POT family-domain-containing protein n=1 Tax=Catenaria anguillulae PL171 TaxID=765915 RepID=A0A1Y2H5G5_9FUNG|nr:POT family-domain-containing protein [Catenaria anguillulae PL171]